MTPGMIVLPPEGEHKTYRLMRISDGAVIDLMCCGCPNEERERMFDYLALHPHFLSDVVREAREAAAHGWNKLSIWMIANALRWGRLKMTDPAVWKEQYGEEYKIPNGILAHLARQAMVENEDLFGFFELRTIKCKVCDL